MPTFVYNSLLHVYGFHGKMNIFTVISINYNSDGKLSIPIWWQPMQVLFWPTTGAVISVIMIQLKLGSIPSCRAKRETFLPVGHLWFCFCFWLKSRTKRLRRFAGIVNETSGMIPFVPLPVFGLSIIVSLFILLADG